eukprot:scaffold56308_cov61-Phaeocystis_antarctica.AAC.10
MGRSSLRPSPPPAHGASPGGNGAKRRSARRVMLQAASTPGGEHVRWALARHSNWPPPLLPSVCNDADRIQIGLWPYQGRAEAIAAALGDETRVIARAV